jgi:DNA invertase Pin-like site-specific DNA recombinase
LEDNVPKVGLYARVSTVGHGQDPEVQLRELRVHAERYGWHEIEEYVDRGVSGSKDRRPALDRLMADARAGKLSTVAVWKIDRFGRSLKHVLTALDEFRSLGIDFVSATEAIDTSTPAGKMIFSVIAAIAEFERGICVERVRSGLAKARAAGKRLGRPQRWTLVQAEKATKLRAEGASWKTVAMTIGLPIGTVRGAVADLAAENPAA